MSSAISWNPAFYQNKHAFVYKYGENLIDILSPQPGERILDIGCGTGQLTNLIRQKGAEVVGIDSSQEMIAQARSAFPEIEFKVKDALNLSYYQKFDAVFSNATIHWIPNQRKLARNIYNALKPRGRMAVEFGGKGNVQNIIGALKKQLLYRNFDRNAKMNLWYFPSIAEYTTLLESIGFNISIAQHYDRNTELADAENGIKDWIQMFCSAYFDGIPDSKKEDIVKAAETSLQKTNYYHGKWYADYKRLRIIATKPSLNT